MLRRTSKNLRVSPSSDVTANGPTLNGFCTIPEVPSIRVDEMNVSPFSMPQEILDYAPDNDAIMTSFRNCPPERKLFSNIELSTVELERLRKLQEESRRQNLAFLPFLASTAVRYAARAQAEPRKALKQMLATQKWRQSYFKDGPITDASISNDMKHGIVYWAGRDSQLRPTLVIRPGRIPEKWHKENGVRRLMNLLVFSLEYMLRYLTYPGKVETGTIILDLKGCTLAQLPFSSIREICTVLSEHYILRINRFYLCNVPHAVHKVSSIGLRFLNERQRQKLMVIRDLEEMQEHFAAHQLEADLGGSRPVLSTFFPFPLQAGPFAAGYDAGARSDAVAHVHRAFTEMGIRGHAWDATLTREENLRVEYSEMAPSLLERCGSRVFESCAKEKVEDSGTSHQSLAPPLLSSRTCENVAILSLKEDIDIRSNATTLLSDQECPRDSLGTHSSDVECKSIDLDFAAASSESTNLSNVRVDESGHPYDIVLEVQQVPSETGWFTCLLCRAGSA